MNYTAKIFTAINYVLSGILWLLGILTLLFNILGFWAPWHLAGFGFVFFIPVTIVPLILSIVFSCVSKNIKLIAANLVSLVISVGFVLITVLVSSTWFW